MTPSGDGYPIDLAEEIIDLAGSFLEADRGSQCRAETHACVARDHEYKRLGTLSLLAGIDLLTGQVHANVEDRHRSREFIGFLKNMDAATRRVPRSRSFWTIIQRTCRRRPKSGLPHSAMGRVSASCSRQSMAPGSTWSRASSRKWRAPSCVASGWLRKLNSSNGSSRPYVAPAKRYPAALPFGKDAREEVYGRLPMAAEESGRPLRIPGAADLPPAPSSFTRRATLGCFGCRSSSSDSIARAITLPVSSPVSCSNHHDLHISCWYPARYHCDLWCLGR